MQSSVKHRGDMMLQLEISASQIAVEIGASSMWIENVLRRGGLSTNVKTTTPGKARMMSRANALELAFLFAFVKVGVKLSTAFAFAAMYVRQDKNGKIREWVYFDLASGAGHAKGTDDLSAANLVELAAKSNPPALVIIQSGEIVRRIDRFFGLSQ